MLRRRNQELAALDDINGGMPVEAVLYKAAVELAFLMVKTYEPEFHQDAFNEVGEVIARAMNEAIRAERRGVQ